MASHLRHLPRASGFVLLIALMGSGCASGPRDTLAAGPNPPDLAALPGKPGCFWLRNFDGSWTALNQRQLLVYAPLTSPPYLVQLFQPIPTLRFAQRLGFEDVERSGMICNNAADYAIVPNWQPHRVTITAVHQVTEQEARQLLLANGLKAPRQKTRS
ncbi:MAG TPA: DUF6491 family protein [Steroidobacteraceae bacterium]|jgi:hypothetical protein